MVLAELIICPIMLLAHHHKDVYVKGVSLDMHVQARQAAFYSRTNLSEMEYLKTKAHLTSQDVHYSLTS